MTILRQLVGAACLAASVAATAAAASDLSAAPQPGGTEHGYDAAPVGPGHDPHDDARDHGPGGPGAELPFADEHHLHRLHRLGLTEAQQDKLFAIHHAAAPQRREQDKAIRKAHEALRELVNANRFDEARAAAVSRDLGQAVAARALAEARLEAQVLAVLTPEQREQLRQGHQRGMRGGPGEKP